MVFPNPVRLMLPIVQVATTFDLSDQSKAPKLIAESTWNYEIWLPEAAGSSLSPPHKNESTLATHTAWLVYPVLWNYCFRVGAPWWLISGCVNHFQLLCFRWLTIRWCYDIEIGKWMNEWIPSKDWLYSRVWLVTNGPFSSLMWCTKVLELLSTEKVRVRSLSISS
jgi:hypothetical protein